MKRTESRKSKAGPSKRPCLPAAAEEPSKGKSPRISPPARVLKSVIVKSPVKKETDVLLRDDPRSGLQLLRAKPFVRELPRQNSSSLLLKKKTVRSDNVQLYDNFSVKWPKGFYPRKEVTHIEFVQAEREKFYPRWNCYKNKNWHDEMDGQLVYMCRPEFTRPFCPSGHLRFESRFECGNLEKVLSFGKTSYYGYLRFDLRKNEKRELVSTGLHLTQWFYFSVENMDTVKPYRFTIMNIHKTSSVFGAGAKPLVYSEILARICGVGWHRIDNKMIYEENSLTGDLTGHMLTFDYTFPYERDTVYFASGYPYSYTYLMDYAKRLAVEPHQENLYMKKNILCITNQGNVVPMISISSDERLTENPFKPVIVITARIHPSETSGSWVCHGIMKFLMGNTRVAMQLRLTFTFVIIPMLNPDGVLVGNGRYNLQGVDLNRKFACIDTKFYAPVSSLTALVQRLATKRQMYIYCDIHGHSKRFNSFIYGSDDTALHAKAREFARLLKIYCGDKFNMDDCLFNNQEPEKTHSSRIALHKLGVPLAFTFENSTGGCSLGLKARTHFTTLDYVQIGEGFCHAILDFNRIYPNLAAEKQVAHGPKLKLKPKPKPKPKEPSRTDSAKSFKPSCLPKHQFYSMPTENESSSKLRTCERKKATTAIKKAAEKGTIEMKKKTPIKSGTLAVQKATTATKKKTPIEGGTLAEQKATTATKAKAPTKGGTSTVSSSRDKVTSKSVAAKNMPTSLASAQLPKARKKLLATEVRAMKKMKAVQGPSPAEKHTLEPKKPLPHKNVSLYKNFSVKWPYEDYVKKTGMKHKRGKPVSKERFAAAESKFKENNMDKNELDVVYQCNSAFVYKITLPGETLIFESRFESGNLQQAVCLVQNSTDSGKGNQPTPSQPSADSTSTIVQNSTDSGKDVQLTPRQPSSDSTSTIVQDSTDSGKYDQPMSRQPSTDSTSTMKAEKLFLKREPSREWKVAEKPTIPNSYHLTLRKDLILCLDPPKALKELNVAETQWFYFSVENMAQDKAYIFSIESIEKSDSPFSSRIKPLVYSEKAAKEKGVGWHRIGDSMRYDRREIGKSALSKKVLTFSYTTSYEEDTVYFASDYPYTYTALMDYLKKIGLLRQLPCHFKKNVLCSTHMGNIIPWITITKGDTQPDCLTKPVIIIMARAHPGEACSSWVCKGIMDFLISDDKDAEELRRIFIFKIIPMLNPDGVILGNWRRDLMGFDMNRQYRHPRIPASSVIKETTSFIQKCTSTGKLYIFCDIHGHSELCNRLVFGCKSKSSLAAAEEFVHTLVKNSSHMISKEDCIFNSTEVEEKYTARMAAQTHYIPLSFTFQVTNAGTSTGLLGMLHVDIDDYQNLGEFFCRGVLDYYKTRKSLEKRAVHRVRAVQ